MTEQEIAEQLNEANVGLIQKVVNTLGGERAHEYLQQTLTLEAGAGLLTAKGDRRRSPGGVFFYLIKEGVSQVEREQIWPPSADAQPAGQAPTGNQAKRVIKPLSWDEAKRIIGAINQTPGKGATVKLTLIGRPKKVAKAGEEAVVVSLQGKPPGALPKGLPVPPEVGITWAVFIVNKQWNKVKDSMTTNPHDSLIIEGYPMVDKNGIGIVLATNVKSKMMEMAGRPGQR